MYGMHPSQRLVSLFKVKPYQGQDPEQASVIFVGRDANYSEAISDHPFFDRIIEYHEDGVGFWQRHGVHHPFLLPSYPFDRVRGGVKYHATFAKMGLGSEVAPLTSFVELLDVPTIGVTGAGEEGVFESLLSDRHLERLESLILGGSERIVFISPSVRNDMWRYGKRYGRFRWLKDFRQFMPDTGRPILVFGNTKVYLTYHFSEGRVHAQLPAMARIISDSM